jgi:hypothetical protein
MKWKIIVDFRRCWRLNERLVLGQCSPYTLTRALHRKSLLASQRCPNTGRVYATACNASRRDARIRS